MADNKNIDKLIEFLSISINQNIKTASELRKWISHSSPVQKDILMATECIEMATYTLKATHEQLRGIPKKKFGLLSQSEIDKIAEHASSLMPDDPSLHYHCSEAFTIAVGEHFFGSVNDRLRRITTGFAGGVGGTHDEMCGALFGGILIISSIFGRARPYEDDERCYQKSIIYKEQFLKEFKGTRCQEIKDTGYGSQGTQPCSVLVGKAVKVFFRSLMLD